MEPAKPYARPCHYIPLQVQVQVQVPVLRCLQSIRLVASKQKWTQETFARCAFCPSPSHTHQALTPIHLPPDWRSSISPAILANVPLIRGGYRLPIRILVQRANSEPPAAQHIVPHHQQEV